MTNAIVIGDGGHAASVIDLLLRLEYSVVGTIKKNGTQSTSICGIPTIGTDLDLPEIRKSVNYAFNGVGQIKSPQARIEVHDTIKKLNFKYPAVISPDAYISKFSRLANGVSVHAKCFINAQVTIGENCIINSGSIIEHDTKVGDNCHISTATVLNGNVNIGKNCFIGSGCIIYQNVKIPDNTIIKSGSIIRT